MSGPVDVPARILVLEDDDNLRDVLVEVLQNEGFTVSSVSRGEAAVAMATREPFDLIIADIRMDGMGGLDAVEQTQKLQPGIGSLIVSGYATETETARAEQLQVGGYLTKPFKMQELLTYVRGQLARRADKGEDPELLRLTLDWSLGALASLIDDTGMLEGSLSGAAASAEALCRQFHQPAPMGLAARWATILRGAAGLPNLALPPELLSPNRQLPELTSLLKTLAETPHGESLPTPVQAVGLALAVHLRATGDADLLHAELDGRFRGDLIEAILTQGPLTAPRPRAPLRGEEETVSPQHRSLASLGRTLERVGDRESARQAYQTLTQEGVAPREQLTGWLGLARLAVCQGKSSQARELCIKALRLARSQGPSTLAQHGMEAALLLEQSGAEETQEALRAVFHAAQGMGLTVKMALLRLALGAGEPELPVLLAPQAGQEIAPHLDWLLAHLIGRPTLSPGLGQLLARQAQDFPRAFLHWFDPVRCPSERRLEVATLLGGVKYLPEPVLAALEAAPEPALRDFASTLRARQEGSQATPILRVLSLGPLELSCQGEAVPESVWKTRKIKFLFAMLASSWGKPFSEDQVMEAFWPKDISRNKNNLYWATSTLRGVLRSVSPRFETALVRTHESLALHPEFPRWHDLEEFERAAAEGQRLDSAGEAEAALVRYRQAARVYRGPYLEGCYHDFALEVRGRTEGLALASFVRASHLALQRSLDEEAAELAASAVELAPYRQDAQALRMRALIRLNRGPQAIEHFQRLEKDLREEYETEPSTELLELFHRARLGYTDA